MAAVARRGKKAKRTGHLRHYGLFLDTVQDKAVIDYLEQFIETRRVGQVLRAAMLAYMGADGGRGASIVAATVQMPMAIPQAPSEPPPMHSVVKHEQPGYLPEPTADTDQTAAKVRRSFMK
jgi:hypothetical protein